MVATLRVRVCLQPILTQLAMQVTTNGSHACARAQETNSSARKLQARARGLAARAERQAREQAVKTIQAKQRQRLEGQTTTGSGGEATAHGSIDGAHVRRSRSREIAEGRPGSAGSSSGWGRSDDGETAASFLKIRASLPAYLRATWDELPYDEKVEISWLAAMHWEGAVARARRKRAAERLPELMPRASHFQQSLRISDEDRKKLGSRWRSIGSTRPMIGREIDNRALANALRERLEISPSELAAWGLTDLRRRDFIRAGSSYFQPVVQSSYTIGDDCGRIGCEWTNLGLARPTNGVEIFNRALVDALRDKCTFSEDELDAMGVPRTLESHSFVRVGAFYFEPVVTIDASPLAGSPAPSVAASPRERYAAAVAASRQQRSGAWHRGLYPAMEERVRQRVCAEEDAAHSERIMQRRNLAAYTLRRRGRRVRLALSDEPW